MNKILEINEEIKNDKLILDLIEHNDNKQIRKLSLEGIRYTEMAYSNDIMKIINDEETINKLNKMGEELWVEWFYESNFRKWNKFKKIEMIDPNWRLLKLNIIKKY